MTITLKQFTKLAGKTRMKPLMLSAAHHVLVLDLTVSEAALHVERTPQAVSKAVATILNAGRRCPTCGAIHKK